MTKLFHFHLLQLSPNGEVSDVAKQSVNEKDLLRMAERGGTMKLFLKARVLYLEMHLSMGATDDDLDFAISSPPLVRQREKPEHEDTGQAMRGTEVKHHDTSHQQVEQKLALVKEKLTPSPQSNQMQYLLSLAQQEKQKVVQEMGSLSTQNEILKKQELRMLRAWNPQSTINGADERNPLPISSNGISSEAAKKQVLEGIQFFHDARSRMEEVIQTYTQKEKQHVSNIETLTQNNEKHQRTIKEMKLLLQRQAEEYEALIFELKEKKSNDPSPKGKQLTEEKAALEDEVEQLYAQNAQLRENQSTAMSKLSQLQDLATQLHEESSSSGKYKQQWEEVQKQLDKKDKTISQLRKETDILRSSSDQVDECSRLISQLQQEKKESQSRIDNLKAQLEDLQAEYSILTSERDSAMKEKDYLDKMLNTIRNQHREEIEHLHEKIAVLRSTQEAKYSELLNDQNMQLKEENLKMKDRQVDLQLQLDILKTARTRLEESLSAYKSRCVSAESMSNAVTSEKEQWRKQLLERQEEIALLREELSTTEEHSAMISESYEKIIQKNDDLLKEKDRWHEEKDELLQKQKQRAEHLESLQSELKHFQSLEKETRKKLSMAKSRLLALQHEKATLTNTISDLKLKIQSMTQEADVRVKTLNEKEQEIRTLQVKLQLVETVSDSDHNQMELKLKKITESYHILQKEHEHSKKLIIEELEYIQGEYLACETRVEELRSENDILKKKWANSECGGESAISLEAQLMEIQTNYRKLRTEMENRYNMEKSDFEKQLHKLQSELSQKVQQFEDLTNLVQDKEKQLKEMKDVISSYSNTIMKKNEALCEMKLRSTAHQDSKELAESQLHSLQGRMNGMADENEALNDQLIELEHERDQLKSNLNDVQQSIELEQRRNDELSSQISSWTVEHETSRKQMEEEREASQSELSRRTEEFRQRILTMENQVLQLQEALKQRKAKSIEMDTEMIKVQKKYDETLDEIRESEHEKQRKISQLNEELYRLQEQQQAKSESAIEERHCLEKQLDEAQQRCKELEVQRAQLQDDLSTSQRQLKELRHKSLEGDLSMSSITKLLEQKDSQIDALKIKLEVAHQNLEDEQLSRERETSLHKKTTSALQSQTDELKLSVERLETKLQEEVERARKAGDSVALTSTELSTTKKVITMLETTSGSKEKMWRDKTEHLQASLTRTEAEVERWKEKVRQLTSDTELEKHNGLELTEEMNRLKSENLRLNQHLDSLKRISSREKDISFNAVQTLRETNLSLQKQIRELQAQLQSREGEEALNTLEKERLREALKEAEIQFSIVTEKLNKQNASLLKEYQRKSKSSIPIERYQQLKEENLHLSNELSYHLQQQHDEEGGEVNDDLLNCDNDDADEAIASTTSNPVEGDDLELLSNHESEIDLEHSFTTKNFEKQVLDAPTMDDTEFDTEHSEIYASPKEAPIVESFKDSPTHSQSGRRRLQTHLRVEVHESSSTEQDSDDDGSMPPDSLYGHRLLKNSPQHLSHSSERGHSTSGRNQQLERLYRDLSDQREDLVQFCEQLKTNLEDVRFEEKEALKSLTRINSNVENLNKEYRQLHDELDSTKHERAEIEQSFETIKDEEAQHKQQLGEIREEIKSRKRRANDMDIERINRLKTSLQKAQELESQKNSVIERLNNIIATTSHDLKEVEQVRIDSLVEVSTVQHKLRELENRKEHIQEEMRSCIKTSKALRRHFSQLKHTLLKMSNRDQESLIHIREGVAQFEESIRDQLSFIAEMNALNEQKNQIDEMLKRLKRNVKEVEKNVGEGD
eukprot:CAMPEP_0117443770 /NCGR_PEP_ID=MMETSP0759-20121206/4876_1 /TAXON_ID=63605 /ORGANISM="Percolomonas cosmopolitus, Strain WS" /LENGTH=1788 /DNA_ID=CAMNT_0005235775 /DNA_START=243 /DNA_END=5609 /DNA_ORIENTATION=-